MNIYNLLKLAAGKRLPQPIKILGLWAMHITGKRTLGIFFDPILSCNLSCRMCYFSDKEKRNSMKGMISNARLEQVDKALFHRAMKLQIGCGAEPTLYPHLIDIVKRGEKAGIPYISLTTNGQLIASGRTDLMKLAQVGLNELTLSLHGTDKETYEYLMPGADFDKLLQLIKIVGEVKKRFPDFVLRVNFTVNSRNVDNLSGDKFWTLWKEGAFPDIIQLRPVQNLGVSEWKDFDLSSLIQNYDSTIGSVIMEAQKRGITCIAPDLDQLKKVDETQEAPSAFLEDFSYCYIDPNACYKDDFDPLQDTYESYHKRHKSGRFLFKSAFSKYKAHNKKTTKKMNYDVK